MKDVFDAWERRLRAVGNLVLILPRETQGQRLDDHARPTSDLVVLPAATQVRYVETSYDAMRLDEAMHTVKIVSGPAAGRWAGLVSAVGPGPLPWEE
jgi:hypothetical protein